MSHSLSLTLRKGGFRMRSRLPHCGPAVARTGPGYVRRILPLAGLLALSGCGRLDSIPYSPPQTPESWLTIQPTAAFKIASKDVILVQPSTSAIVYLLGVLTIGAGLYFLRIRNGQRSRLWWGIALLLWGVGALFAGTGYEAFSYQIKCAGREVCIWTSWWEVIYLVLSVASVDAMMLAEAYSCTAGKWRRALSIYALANAVLYAGIAWVGAMLPVKFLISFELLILVAAPSVLAFILLNGWRAYKLREGMDRALLGTWLWLAITLAAYFLYLVLGITDKLWARGIWFSANDALHIGLIGWMIYIVLVVAKRVEDRPGRPAPAAPPHPVVR